MATPPASQTDSENLQDRFQIVLTDLELIENIPPMADGMDFPTFRDDVTRRFDNITQSLETLETLTTSLAAFRIDMTQRVDEMKLRIMAVETVTRSSDWLSPIRGPNNEEIRDFPVSFGAIRNLAAPELDRLLFALGLKKQPEGLEDKRNRLIKHIKGLHLV